MWLDHRPRCAILDRMNVSSVAVVDALLLRSQLPELVLRPGANLVARVASRAPGELGVLVLAGVPLTAKLPDEVVAGETLRLTVTDVSAEQVTMRMEPQAAPLAGPGAPPLPPPRVLVEEPPRRGRREDGEEVHTVALAFASATLGRLDLRLELSAAGGLQASVVAPAGEPHARAEADAQALREALEARTGLPASVRVLARRAPLDLYA